jgi:hypothetical protein
MASEATAKKIEAIFDILNAPGLVWKITKSLLDTFNAVMTNMTSEKNSKYLVGGLVALAAIANGIAFSGLGMTASGQLRCGPGTVEDSGWCVVKGAHPPE